MLKNNTLFEFDFLLWVSPFLVAIPFLTIYSGKYYVFPLCAGIILLCVFIYIYQKIYFSNKWIKTKGKYKKYNLVHVKYIGILNYHVGDDMLRPYCLYTYEVDGKTYKNDKLCILNKDFLTHEQFKKNAHYIAGKNSKTKEVDVYYNPKNPNESILVKGTTKMSAFYFILALGIVSTSVGLWYCPCF